MLRAAVTQDCLQVGSVLNSRQMRPSSSRQSSWWILLLPADSAAAHQGTAAAAVTTQRPGGCLRHLPACLHCRHLQQHCGRPELPGPHSRRAGQGLCRGLCQHEGGHGDTAEARAAQGGLPAGALSQPRLGHSECYTECSHWEFVKCAHHPAATLGEPASSKVCLLVVAAGARCALGSIGCCLEAWVGAVLTVCWRHVYVWVWVSILACRARCSRQTPA